MKLQINSRGGWKDLCEFEPHQLRQIQEAIVVLAQALAWRITANVARSPKVVAHLDPARALKWRKV